MNRFNLTKLNPRDRPTGGLELFEPDYEVTVEIVSSKNSVTLTRFAKISEATLFIKA